MATVPDSVKRQILVIGITMIAGMVFCIDEVANHELPERITILCFMLFKMGYQVWNLPEFAAEIGRDHSLSKEQYRKKYRCSRLHARQK